MYGFDRDRIVAAVVRVLNYNYNYIAQLGRYFKAEDIEDVEVWFIGIKIKFRKGIMPRRFTMVSKAAVCTKSAPSKKEAVFIEGGKSIGDRLHLSTYKINGEEKIWTVSLGYNTKAEAEAMQYWLWKKDKAAHSIVRKGERTKCTWELKVWELCLDVLDKCIERSLRSPTVQIDCGTLIYPGAAEPFPNDRETLQRLYELPTSRELVERKIAQHPEWNLEIWQGRVEQKVAF